MTGSRTPCADAARIACVISPISPLYTDAVDIFTALAAPTRSPTRTG
jgi:hypothetical protein